jgi:osmotically-inducible protein OsmY
MTPRAGPVNPTDAEIADAVGGFLRRAAPGASVVECRRGVVVIAGVAATRNERRAVEDFVRAHEGVRGVVNRLRVGAGPKT